MTLVEHDDGLDAEMDRVSAMYRRDMKAISVEQQKAAMFEELLAFLEQEHLQGSERLRPDTCAACEMIERARAIK